MTLLIKIVALLICGLLVGNEFAVAVFVHLQLYRLPDDAHARAAQAFARILGRFMPFWYAGALVATFAVAIALRGTGAAFTLAVTAAIGWVVSIVYTVLLPVPINNRIAAWNLDDLPADWKQDRKRWDRLHALRVAWITLVFVCLAAACVLPHAA